MEGLRIGIEVHQRLNTGKLFCQCPHAYAKGTPQRRMSREFHLSLSELGKIDIAASREAEKGKSVGYGYYDGSCCLVDADEEPPHRMNRKALAYALGMAKQLNMKIVDRPIVMRKIVIDGSNTSGFQRTMLLGIGGSIETSRGKVGIETLCLEEESAGIANDTDGKRTYSLDRLGIPLIEITTAPDIKDEGHCAEAAERIGLAMRIAGVAERGIGTIRQDLNVSIEGGSRVEIKGAQELWMLPKWIENEAKRQKTLIEIIKKLKARKAYGQLKGQEPVDITETLGKCASEGFVKSALGRGSNAVALVLPHHKGILGTETGPERRYGSELSDYAKQAGVKGIIHSDEDLARYGINANFISEVSGKLGMKPEDGLAIVIADRETALRALRHVKERALADYVPKETRQALPSGATSYMRPIATSARMYPETDIPTIAFDREMEKEAGLIASKTYEKTLEWLNGILNPDLSGKMIRSRQLQLFESLVKQGVDAPVAASTLEDTWTRLSREKVEVTEEAAEDALLLFRDGKLTKKGIYDYIRMVCSGKAKKEALDATGRISGKALGMLLKEHGGDAKGLMREYGGRISAEDLDLG
jgi:glutamyl-tRNA(Gln) amidotransferase subunit E